MTGVKKASSFLQAESPTQGYHGHFPERIYSSIKLLGSVAKKVRFYKWASEFFNIVLVDEENLTAILVS